MYYIISSTGSWLYLHNIHLLPLRLIEATVHALMTIRTARQSHLTTVDLEGETLREAKLEASFCIASTDIHSLQLLPSSIYSVFQMYMYNGAMPIDVDIKIESCLVSCGYKNVTFLKHLLSTLHPCISTCINWNQLCYIVNRAMEHIRTLSSDNYNTAFDHTTYVYSKIAHQVLASKLQQITTQNAFTPSSQFATNLLNISEEEEESDEKCDQSNDMMSLSQTEEVTCLLIAIWELLIPQISSSSVLYKSMVQCLKEAFPDLDHLSVFEKANSVCDELSSQHPWSRDLVESLQESRATSVMYNENTDSESEFDHATLLYMNLCVCVCVRVCVCLGGGIGANCETTCTCILFPDSIGIHVINVYMYMYLMLLNELLIVLVHVHIHVHVDIDECNYFVLLC